MSIREEITEKARRAKRKRSIFGPDIDLSRFSHQPEDVSQIALDSFSKDESELLTMSGLDLTEKTRSGTFLQMDHSVVRSQAAQDGLEIMSIDKALKKHAWLHDYLWRMIPVDTDKYTSQVELHPTKGYFLRALPGVKSTYPLQACLYISQGSISQNVHNIIIVEPGAKLHVVSGCASAPRVSSGIHIGVSEFYVKRGGTLTFTMIHNWNEGVDVRPRTATVVEEGGLFISNYICLQPVKSLQTYPTSYLTGNGAVTKYNNILLATEGTLLDVGSRAYLRKPQCKTEMMTRAITEGGKIWVRGHLIGEAPEIKAHLECLGLILNKGGSIHAIPELEGRVNNLDMTHDASVGKIAKDEILYLMTRGLSEEEAVGTIIRGFLNTKIEGLPPLLQRELDKAVKETEKHLM